MFRRTKSAVAHRNTELTAIKAKPTCAKASVGEGGERGIRTPGPVTVNGFQDRRIRPLCHLSGAKIGGATYPTKSFWRIAIRESATVYLAHLRLPQWTPNTINPYHLIRDWKTASATQIALVEVQWLLLIKPCGKDDVAAAPLSRIAQQRRNSTLCMYSWNDRRPPLKNAVFW